MSHYSKQRESDMRCVVSDEIARHAEEKEDCCPDCKEPVDIILSPEGLSAYCNFCERSVSACEVEQR